MVGHETPTRPGLVEGDGRGSGDPGGPERLGCQPAPFSQGVGLAGVVHEGTEGGGGADTAAVRDPGCPAPGSAGLAGSAGAWRSGAGADQSVPLPALTWPDPSTMTHSGPEVQATAGSTGAVTGPVAGAG